MVVNHNMASICESRQLRYNVKKMEVSSKKLATGYKIIGANDDAAGLQISETMRHQTRGLNKASRNSQDGISMLQTADAALQETQDVLGRMVELTTQAANDTHTDADRRSIQDELDQLNQEVDRIAYTTNFNQQYILAEGTPQAAPGYYRIQSGALNGQSIDIQFVNASKESLGVDKVDVSSHQKASASITMVQDAIEKASHWRDKFGAQQERLEHAVRNTDNTSENTQSAESSKRDTNMNMEMVLYSTNRILVHASQSILAQYNDDAVYINEVVEQFHQMTEELKELQEELLAHYGKGTFLIPVEENGQIPILKQKDGSLYQPVFTDVLEFQKFTKGRPVRSAVVPGEKIAELLKKALYFYRIRIMYYRSTWIK